jgi:hypothetical protein
MTHEEWLEKLIDQWAADVIRSTRLQPSTKRSYRAHADMLLKYAKGEYEP